MGEMTRRGMIKSGAAAAGLAGAGLLQSRTALAEPTWNGAAPEPGASIRVLRWKQFIQAEFDSFVANTKKFSEQTGVKVRVDAENWDDIRPKAAVAANVGAGPDIIMGTNDDPFKFSDKLLDLTDLAEYLGAKYGGWYPIAQNLRHARQEMDRPAAGRHRRLPQLPHQLDARRRLRGVPEGPRRLSQTVPGAEEGRQAAGLRARPRHRRRQRLGAIGACGRMAARWSTTTTTSSSIRPRPSPRSNTPSSSIRPSSTACCRGTTPSNNKAFLADQISLTLNGISIYTVAKNSPEPALNAIADDMDHANMPIGPVGHPTEQQNILNTYCYAYTKYPNAVREYLRFMWEKEQVDAWETASNGYIAPPLPAWNDNPIWTADPKATPFRDVLKYALDVGYSGKLGYASAAVMGDFVVVDMFAEACTGDQTPKAAAQRAADRAKRYYKS